MKKGHLQLIGIGVLGVVVIAIASILTAFAFMWIASAFDIEITFKQAGSLVLLLSIVSFFFRANRS